MKIIWFFFLFIKNKYFVVVFPVSLDWSIRVKALAAQMCVCLSTDEIQLNRLNETYLRTSVCQITNSIHRFQNSFAYLGIIFLFILVNFYVMNFVEDSCNFRQF